MIAQQSHLLQDGTSTSHLTPRPSATVKLHPRSTDHCSSIVDLTVSNTCLVNSMVDAPYSPSNDVPQNPRPVIGCQRGKHSIRWRVGTDPLLPVNVPKCYAAVFVVGDLGHGVWSYNRRGRPRSEMRREAAGRGSLCCSVFDHLGSIKFVVASSAMSSGNHEFL